MANHCSNYIEIHGSDKDIDLFLEKLKENHIILEDEDLEDDSLTNFRYLLDMKSFNDVEETNYSPRWFLINSIEFDEELLTIVADSAWVPAIAEFEFLSSIFPSLLFNYSYEEPGLDIGGYATMINGEIEHEHLGYWGEILRQDEDLFMHTLEDEISSMMDNKDSDSIRLRDFGSAKNCISEEEFQKIVNKLKAITQ